MENADNKSPATPLVRFPDPTMAKLLDGEFSFTIKTLGWKIESLLAILALILLYRFVSLSHSRSKLGSV